MTATIDASERLIALTLRALDEGIDSVREGGPLIPFVMIESKQGRTLTRFLCDTLDQSIQAARRHLIAKAVDAQRYALALDGYLTMEGVKQDAIIVECAERGQVEGHTFGQRYMPATHTAPLKSVGNAAYLGPSQNLLGPSA